MITKRTLDIFGKIHIKNQIVPAMPYMGNKRKLATKILNSIYDTIGDFETLYDLFGGGGSMSVAGLLAGHKVVYNEYNTGIYNLMKYLISGQKLPNKWISREEFKKHKDGDDWYSGFIKCCWSFGNSQKDYLFGKDIEELKRQAHEYLLANGYDGTSETRVRLVKQFKNDKKIQKRFELEQLERLKRLEQLEHLERLKRLEQLEQLEQLELFNLSYEQVDIKGNCVIYCDPPYENTASYQKTINYDEFYKWCLENKNTVFISEYNMPKEFKKIAEFEHNSCLSSVSNNKVIEKLYWNGICST